MGLDVQAVERFTRFNTEAVFMSKSVKIDKYSTKGCGLSFQGDISFYS